MALTMTILLLVGYVARYLAANWARLGNWLEWVVHHSSGFSFTVIGLLGKSMMAIPLILGCRFWEASSGLSVLDCFLKQWRRRTPCCLSAAWGALPAGGGSAGGAICAADGQRNSFREVHRHIVVWGSLSGATVGCGRVAHGLSSEKLQIIDSIDYLADG